ncbi:hypothetical protein FE374_00055 [Georgenia yuyongxinii]|uniref:Uncharacterized protein n=1 Tax=Georgenia yuyongxinii TaxID=2589797 RepID=A0A5B8BXZ8_9MICO|nr:DUF6098 family protein [Georgenia yuyongxinii]QDC23239.1 hypothetical protein FE374_00055 [Georgenia yuyongxinii]
MTASTIDRPTTIGRSAPTDHLAQLPTLGTLAELSSLQRDHDTLFLRISPDPDTDRLRGHRDGESGFLLPGLPAWSLRPEEWWPAGPRLWAARQLVRHGYLLSGGKGNRMWLLTGEVVGRSADGEPLVAGWTPWAYLASGVLAAAESQYTAWRFRSVC